MVMSQERRELKQRIDALLPALLSAMGEWRVMDQVLWKFGDGYAAHRDIYGVIRIHDSEAETVIMATVHTFSDGTARPVVDRMGGFWMVEWMREALEKALVLHQLAHL